MLASKTGMISLVVVFLFYIGYAVVRFKRYFVAGAALVALIVAFFIAMNVLPGLKERITNLTQMISSDAPIDPKEVESNRVRVLIWNQDMQLISENMLTGVGTGDVQDALMKKYEAAGMTGAYEKKLNAHSQYFQTGIALGIPGLLILLGIFLVAFTWSVRSRYGFCALLTILLAFNFIPESMLQTQAGTLFMGFFYSLILFAADKKVLSPKS
jgi:O-antigen ligase